MKVETMVALTAWLLTADPRETDYWPIVRQKPDDELVESLEWAQWTEWYYNLLLWEAERRGLPLPTIRRYD